MNKYLIKTDSGNFIFTVENARLSKIQLPFTHAGNAENKSNIGTEKVISVVSKALEKFLTAKFDEIDFDELANFWKFKFTPFYERVYKAVINIDPGTTRSYKEIAQMCGSPKASRAVGGAMRHNPYPLLIPCHRVIGASGNLTGYAGKTGIHIKQRLLDWEKQAEKLPTRFVF